MRTRFLTLLACCALTFSLSSCLEEGADTLISSESGLTQEDLDGTTSMSAMAFGYVNDDRFNGTEGETTSRQLILTARDVQNGNRLTGTTNMMYVFLVKQGPGLTGEYVIAGNEVTNEKGIASINYCTNMNFTTGQVDDDVEINNGGSLVITEDGEGGYNVAYSINLSDGTTKDVDFTTGFPVVEP